MRRVFVLSISMACVAFASCTYDRTPNFLARAPAAKPPADYRLQIARWASRYYAEPASVRFLSVTDPVPVRLTLGPETWLICVEIDARERGGPYMGPRRVAIGMMGSLLSAPMERRGFDLRNEDCNAPHLVWRAWTDRG